MAITAAESDDSQGHAVAGVGESRQLQQVIRQIRYFRPDPAGRTRATKVWEQDDRVEDVEAKALVIILATRGCAWALHSGCSMCGYVNDSLMVKVSTADFVAQMESALAEAYRGQEILKIYTSGSFLDPTEVHPEAQEAIMARVPATVKKLIVEAQAQFVTAENVGRVMRTLKSRDGGALQVPSFEVAIGLESASDAVEQYSVNKDFRFPHFVEAAKVADETGTGIKAYILVKPPFLTEREAMLDCIDTARLAAPHSKTISFNPCNVQKNTLVERLFRRKEYRPPWLWSVVEILKEASLVANPQAKTGAKRVQSDIVGGGTKRGAHNCGECDERVLHAIAKFSVTQDRTLLMPLACECKTEWEATLELEGFLQGGAPIESLL
ncbi:MAG: archaeosine biosynthesis radical SAM protein RaSEA [Euryarchaeota archaeon]|nr:archaeosine biosynthesis radical SAM protein RaSEA [Euryarchaeota archaeon]